MTTVAYVFDENTEAVTVAFKHGYNYNLKIVFRGFERALSECEKNAIIIAHGYPQSLLTPEGEYLADDLAKLLGARVNNIYLIACYTGQTLGRDLALKFRYNVLAYTRPFMFITDDKYSFDKDPYLKLTVYPAVYAANTLEASGSIHYAREAHKIATSKVLEYLDNLEEEDYPEVKLLKASVKNNDNSLIEYVPGTPWWLYAIPAFVLALLGMYASLEKLMYRVRVYG